MDRDKKFLNRNGVNANLLCIFSFTLLLFSATSLVFVPTIIAEDLLTNNKIIDSPSTDTTPTKTDDTSSTDTTPTKTDSTPSVDPTPTKTDDTSSTDTTPTKTDDLPSVTLDDTVILDYNETEPKIVESNSNEQSISLDKIVSKTETVFGNVSSGEERKVSTREEETGIEEVHFNATINLSNVKATIIRLKEKPENISLSFEENRSVYAYFDIKLTTNGEYIIEEEIENLKFTFKVEQSWIEDHNINKNTVILIRYHDDEWQNLSTTLISEDNTYVYYEAETPGCSTFVIMGNQMIEISETHSSGIIDIPWITLEFSLIVLCVLLIKGRYIYFSEKKDTKTKKRKN